MASWTRRRVSGAAGACALSLMAMAPAPASGDASYTERRVLAEINDFRAAHDVRDLRSSDSLASSAARYADHILDTDEPHHHEHIWADDSFDLAGENIAWEPGSRRDAEHVVARWVASDSHRRVLLDERFTWGGVGRDVGYMDGEHTTVWVLHVGRK